MLDALHEDKQLFEGLLKEMKEKAEQERLAAEEAAAAALAAA